MSAHACKYPGCYEEGAEDLHSWYIDAGEQEVVLHVENGEPSAAWLPSISEFTFGGDTDIRQDLKQLDGLIADLLQMRTAVIQHYAIYRFDEWKKWVSE